MYLLDGGFSVELYYDDDANHLVELVARTRSLPTDDVDSLEGYAVYVKLDDLTR